MCGRHWGQGLSRSPELLHLPPPAAESKILPRRGPPSQGTETPLAWNKGRETANRWGLNHLLRKTAVTACPGRPGRSVVCARVAQLGLCYCLQHEWGVTFLLMGKREQRSDLSPKHRAAPKLASSKFSISQQTRQCFSGGRRYSEFITVHRAPAASVILTSSVRGVSGSYSFLQ